MIVEYKVFVDLLTTKVPTKELFSSVNLTVLYLSVSFISMMLFSPKLSITAILFSEIEYISTSPSLIIFVSAIETLKKNLSLKLKIKASLSIFLT